MALQALGWLQRTIGLDITGESEFEDHRRTVLHKKGDTVDFPAAPPTPGLVPSAAAPAAQHRRTSEPPLHRRRAADRPLLVAPRTLYFPPPLDRFILNTVRVTNRSEGYLQFKVKATAPQRYAVKPRQGLLPPRGHTGVEIILRPSAEDPRDLRDRFMIQYRPLTPSDVARHQATGDLTPPWPGKRETTWVKVRCYFTAQLPPNVVIQRLSPSGDDDDEEEGEDDSPSSATEGEEGELIGHPTAPSGGDLHLRRYHSAYPDA